LVASKLDGISDMELGVLVTGPGEGSLDRVEMVTACEEAGDEGKAQRDTAPALSGYWIVRKNEFLGRWIKHGGFWPDPKLRLFRRGCGRFQDRAVHETVQVSGLTATLKQGALLHHRYPTVSDYIDHMNRYSSLAAEMAVGEGRTRFSVINIAVRPLMTFVYNYFFRLLLTAAKDCCCTFVTRCTFPGNTRRCGNWRTHADPNPPWSRPARICNPSLVDAFWIIGLSWS
jgi:hypothetical protein